MQVTPRQDRRCFYPAPSICPVPPGCRESSRYTGYCTIHTFYESDDNPLRQLYTARLANKLLLSDVAQCFHLEFAVDELPSFAFNSGQFVSCVADDPKTGKPQTRAYSIASAARENMFDICVNRVEGGFFSNLLCDLNEGDTVKFHGAHGLFTLRQPLVDSVFIATGTGIAPMRGFAQWLFPEDGPNRSEGKDISLVYGTRYESDIYYQDYFEQLAAKYPNFHYVATLSRGQENWGGERGYVQEHVARLVAARAEQKVLVGAGGVPPESSPGSSPNGPFEIYAYICGLNDMVTASRDRLVGMGWEKKQVVFERYD